MVDINGNEVVLGDFVEILYYIEDGLEFIEAEAASEIRDSVGQILEVCFLDEHGRAWVDLISSSDEEGPCGQTLFLKSDQLKKANKLHQPTA